MQLSQMLFDFKIFHPPIFLFYLSIQKKCLKGQDTSHNFKKAVSGWNSKTIDECISLIIFLPVILCPVFCLHVEKRLNILFQWIDVSDYCFAYDQWKSIKSFLWLTLLLECFEVGFKTEGTRSGLISCNLY